jgi:hypothetical protein
MERRVSINIYHVKIAVLLTEMVDHREYVTF